MISKSSNSGQDGVFATSRSPSLAIVVGAINTKPNVVAFMDETRGREVSEAGIDFQNTNSLLICNEGCYIVQLEGGLDQSFREVTSKLITLACQGAATLFRVYRLLLSHSRPCRLGKDGLWWRHVI